MINSIRTQTIPSSLDNDEIKAYVKACADHKDYPDTNPAPSKPSGYRSADLLDAFDECFYGKCYLTEEWFPNSYKMDVEHFIPQCEDASLVYEWSNLYPAEHNANMSKPRNTPEGGYLDPCNPADDVENEIIYLSVSFTDDPSFEAKDPTNQKAMNSAELLTRLHNGHDNYSHSVTETLRYALRKKYEKILTTIIAWQGGEANSQEQFERERELRALLSRKSSYTMLCRSIPAVRQHLDARFFD